MKSVIFRVFSSILNVNDSVKMALIVRNDIKMTKGKTAAQCSHASVLCYQKSISENPKILRDWCFTGQPKIVLKANNEDELDLIVQNAKKKQIVAEIVRDAGKTQLAPGTVTVIGLGPDLSEKIDELVKHLKLL